MANEHGNSPGIPILIDHKKFTATEPSMTGSQLRALLDPHIGPDRDLWLTVPGPADDLLIGNNQTVELKPGMQFYTAPTTINPGGSDAVA